MTNRRSSAELAGHRTEYGSPDRLRDVRGLVIDMDGVLWRGDTPVPGLVEFFDLLRRRQIRFRLATNNPTRTPEQYVTKLAAMGVSVTADEILTSAVVTAQYLAANAAGARVHVIGTASLREALAAHGLQVSNGGSADVVAVGLDPQLTYSQLAEAALLIRAGARFVGCNPDPTLPSERGLLPGNGATLAYLHTATGVAPLIIGKPERAIFDAALTAMHVAPGEAATLGDRLDTDILGGQRAGMRSILVLSGATDRALLASSAIQPDWVFDSIRELATVWP